MSRRPVRVLGIVAFLVGGVAFFVDGLWRAGVNAFIVGTCALILAEVKRPPPRRPSRRNLYRRQRLDDAPGQDDA